MVESTWDIRFPYGTSIRQAMKLDPSIAHFELEWSDNNTLTMDEVSFGSAKKPIWKCLTYDHEYSVSFAHRLKGAGCPFCSGKRVLKGFNDFESKEPELATEWSIDNTRLPDEFTHKSEYIAIWDCPKGHPWKSTIANRVLGNGCGVCYGSQFLVGVNDVASQFPSLAKEWASTNKSSPDKVSFHSNLRVDWVCELGHEWNTKLAKRVRSELPTGCPTCANKRILAGFNDFGSQKPDLAKRWHPTKNTKTPQEVTVWSFYNAWWICDEKHDYQSTVASQSFGSQCNYCSGKYVWSGFNDLKTLFPEIAKEWHEEKNGRPADKVMPGRNHLEWWICTEMHEWQASPNERTRTDVRKGVCRLCSDAHTSQVEGAFRDWLSTRLDSVETNHKMKIKLGSLPKPIQIDIMAVHEGKKTAIEYDGVWWHREDHVNARDVKKTNAMLEDGYLVVRIREGDLVLLDVTNPNLFQLNHKWSLKPEDIERTGNQILDWLREVI